MSPATLPRDDPRATRLIAVDAATGGMHTGVVGDLATLLRAGDVLVCNDAATLPASLRGLTGRGEAVELRLAGQLDGPLDGPLDRSTFLAVLFGDGDWRARTEDRPPPPVVAAGETLHFTALAADVVAVDRASPRLLTLRFDRAGSELWRALYGNGRPVQYSHVARPLALWDVQTPFGGRPWAVEAPSAAFAVTWDLLSALRARGVDVARITHGAGLSSTGDAALDARLPFAERYDVPAATVAAIARARARGGRVVAVGTSTVRALESAALPGPAGGPAGELAAGTGTTDLRLHAGTELRVADAIVTGMHEPGTSHFALLEAFAPRDLLLRATERAETAGFLAHEFGDLMWIVRTPRAIVRAAG